MLELIGNLDFVKKNNLKITEISKNDKYLLSNEKDEYIIHLYAFSTFNKINKRFERLKELNLQFPNASIYEDIGFLNEKKCYRIEKKLVDDKLKIDFKNLYEKGYEIGSFVKEFHLTFQSGQCTRWYKHYSYRINKVLHRYGLCSYKGDYDYIIFDFLEANKYLIKERTSTTIVGITSVDDIVIASDGGFQFIEDYKILRSDSYFEFICFNLNKEGNPYLLSGIIDGYFDNRVPRSFFKLLGIYTIVESLYKILDSKNIDLEELKIQIDRVNELYDKFSSVYPIWYSNVKKSLKDL